VPGLVDTGDATGFVTAGVVTATVGVAGAVHAGVAERRARRGAVDTGT